MTHRILIVFVVGLVGAAVCGAQALAQDQDRSARYPNEPEGFVPWFSHDWKTWPTRPGERMFASEAGMIRGSVERPEGNQLIDDPDAPHGRGKSLRHWQFKGQHSGSGGGGYHLFHPKPDAENSTRYEDQVKLRSIYRSHWFHIEPDPVTGDWQFGSDHMRTFWTNRFYNNTVRFINLSVGSPLNALPPNRHDRFPGPIYWHYPDHASGHRKTYLFADRSELPIDKWYHVESLFEIQGDLKYGRGEGAMNTARIRMWLDGELVADDVKPAHVFLPFANETFSMIWLGGQPAVTRHPQADAGLGGWTDQTGGTSDIYKSLDASDQGDETFVQSPLNPSDAAYVAEWQFPEVPELAATAHRTHHRYSFAKNEAGGQPIDLTVEVVHWNGSGWEVVRNRNDEPYSVTHTDISETVSENSIATATNSPRFETGQRYGLRFTASGGEGDARRAAVYQTSVRTVHYSRRTQDDYIRFGDIYISGLIYEEE